MGGNGSHASGFLEKEDNREYRTIFTIGDNIKVLEQKNPKKGGKLPEESRTPNRIYVSLYANGTDVKAIAQYDENGKKIYEIHTADHKGIKPHYHEWKDGQQVKGAHHLTPEMKQLLKKVKDYESEK